MTGSALIVFDQVGNKTGILRLTTSRRRRLPRSAGACGWALNEGVVSAQSLIERVDPALSRMIQFGHLASTDPPKQIE
jgi:hypothetical protein